MDPAEALTWKQIQEKDLRVFESYYKAYYKPFLLLAHQYTKRKDLAEEIVNDVFMKIWEDAPQIVITSSLKSYVYRSVINRSINVLNRQKRELAGQKSLESLPPETFELRDMEMNELKIRLYKAIDELPDQCGKVFRMSRFEGLKQQDIADKMGISIKTVKNHITHALKTLSKTAGIPMVGLLVLLEQIFSERH
jgi:RNA polymerase sigma-70 factor (ECF subfamily)